MINKKDLKEKVLKLNNKNNKSNSHDDIIQIHDHYYSNMIKSLIGHQGFFFKNGSAKQFPKLLEEL